MPKHAGLRLKVLLAAVLASLGCGAEKPSAEKPSAESHSNIADSVGLESGRVGSVRIDASLDSVMQRATLIGEDLRTSIFGGDLDRYLRIAIGKDTLEIVARDGRVGGFLVRSPRWRTAEGLGVGTSAPELSRYPLSEATFLAEGLFVSLRTHCGVYFVFPEANVTLAHEDDEVTSERLEQLGDSVRVSMLVVGGAC